MYSLDAAITEMGATGHQRLSRALELAANVRDAFTHQPTTPRLLRVYGAELARVSGIVAYDPCKVVVDVCELSISGYEAGRWLATHHKLNPEFADLRRMIFSITVGDTEKTVQQLITALQDLEATHAFAPSAESRPRTTSRWPKEAPAQALTPRQTANKATECVSIEEAVGRVSAEMAIPYPPGVPLIVPGEASDDMNPHIHPYAYSRRGR